MNHFSVHGLWGGAAMAILSGCSGADRTAAEPVGAQTQAVTSANVALVPATLTGAGKPMLTQAATIRVASAAAQTGAATQLAVGDPNVSANLRSVALRISSSAGVAAPATMRAVGSSDHQAAATVLSGAIINDHAPVYVIKMTGGPFTAKQHPPGVAAPQGKVLTVTVDAATYRVTDVGYVDVEPDLSQIGSGAVDL